MVRRVMPHFTSDLEASSTPLPHFWEECLGSGHAPLALRDDWQKQVKPAAATNWERNASASTAC